MSDKISSAGRSTGRPAPPGERENRYVRKIVRDGFEFEISRKFALFLLDGKDKDVRLALSSRASPYRSYSGISEIWRERSELADAAAAGALSSTG
jgi:hypothetical protein